MRTRNTVFAVTCLATAAAASAQPKPEAGPGPAVFQSMEWRNIGPFRGGRVVAVTGVRQEPGTFYFGSVGGGVWKTTDAGESWTNVSDGQLRTASVGAIAVAPSDPNVVYVGMGEHAVRGVATSHGDGVYKSTDAGKTWKHLGLEKTRQISAVRVHPSDPDLVYVAAQGAPYGKSADRGVYRSRDGGKSWEKVLYVGENAGPSALAMDPTNPRVLYAAFWDHLRQPWQVRSGGPDSGLHKSSDGGSSWEKLEAGLPKLMGKIGVAVAASGSRVYAVVEADPGGGLYRSDDGGKSWALQSQQWSIKSRAWYYMKVFADPRNPDVVWVCNAPLSRSIDGGKTFANVPVPHGDNHDLWIHPDDPSVLINANDGGANVSRNGGRTWSTQENQPTAQFYRVNTDNRFPYRVYGGQQDNTTVAIASRTFGPGITWKDWHPVGGCESGYVAFDPDDPRHVYAGCYQGQISEWDARSEGLRDVMAYPALPLALPSREMKYRFNWNAPIAVSPQDPKVVYHGANVLLRSADRGRTWTEISPDLTRDEDAKQGPQGAPITNEGAGGEVYGTLSYVAPSRHDARTIWTGSDDGLVHLTRDGGASWQNVTPPSVGEALVNAIEVSPHDPATAYVAVTRYKFNDFTPHAFRTSDYGKSWQRIVEGIAPEAFVRVVREDPARRDLLYAGTETGAYVSFDGGRRWQSLQLNLPVTPITDMKIQGDDLVASTQGRAFWILDNLTPLRQADARVAAAEAHLYAPQRAIRVFGGFGFGPSARAGKNPPAGATIDYVLAKAPEAPITLEVLDGSGRVVRKYSSEKKEGEAAPPPGDGPFGPPRPQPLPTKAGMNRFGWDMRHEPVPAIPGQFVYGSLQGRKALPGSYQVRLTVAGKAQIQPLELVKDPRGEASLDDLRAQEELVARLDGQLAEIHKAVGRIRAVRGQVEELARRAKEHGGEAAALEADAKPILEKLTLLEEALVQKRTVDGQTVINFPVRLNHHFIALRMAVDGSEAAPTEGHRRRLADIEADWGRQRAALEALLGPELEAFNKKVRDRNVPPVAVLPAR